MRLRAASPSRGIRARAFGAKFRQIRQAHHITGDAHQMLPLTLAVPRIPALNAKTKANQRLRITLDGFVQRQNVADPGMIKGMVRRDGLQMGDRSGSSPYGRRALRRSANIGTDASIGHGAAPVV